MANRIGPDTLRHVVKIMGYVTESFNQRFTAVQLLALYQAYLKSDGDIYPDAWAPRQIREALLGIPPDFDEHARPRYPMTGARKRILRARTHRIPRSAPAAPRIPSVW